MTEQEPRKNSRSQEVTNDPSHGNINELPSVLAVAPHISDSGFLPPFDADTLIEETYPPRTSTSRGALPRPGPAVAANESSVDVAGEKIPEGPPNPRLRLITPRIRPTSLLKPWHDPRMFTNLSHSTTKEAETSVNWSNQPAAPPVAEYVAPPEPVEAMPSPTARRLSQIPDISVDQKPPTSNLPPFRQRGNSLTPLSYLSNHDGLEQFVEQSPVDPAPEERPHDVNLVKVSLDALAHVNAQASAEHFSVPRHTICAGIKIEITPPSAIRDINLFILDTIIIEVPEEDLTGSPVLLPITHSLGHVLNIQQLGSSTTELRTISPVVVVASATQNPSPTFTAADNVSHDLTVRSDSVPPLQERRRTKLIAINVRRQTLSAVPRIPKTVRFTTSPHREVDCVTSATESVISDVRKPPLWLVELVGGLQTVDQLETESEEPFILGLLRVYDFSTKELQQMDLGATARTMFTEERNALRKCFEARLEGVAPPQLAALEFRSTSEGNLNALPEQTDILS